jgi:hypothetical protein
MTTVLLLLAMLVLSMVFVPLVSAQEKGTVDSSKTYKLTGTEKKLIEEYNFTVEDIQYYKDLGFDAKTILKTESKVKYIGSLPAVVQEAPYRPMLVADSETQKAILGHIDGFSVSDTEKKSMKEAMSDIWSRMPDGITTEDYSTLEEIGGQLNSYLGDRYWKDEVTAKWTATPHGDFIFHAVMNVYDNRYWANYAKSYADDPDSMDTGFARYYNHFYHPVFPTAGGAPNQCAFYGAIALNYYTAGDSFNAFKNLGYSSHYLSDVGNPMHTDGVIDQYLDEAPHIAYENYVYSNWDYGYNYRSIVSSNTASKTVTNPVTATKNLAAYSNPYYDTLWDEITANPSGFGSDIDVRYATSKVIRETAKYNVGLAEYIST